MAYKIYDDDDFPHMQIIIDGCEVFGMSLSGVAPESREWLANHIDKGFETQVTRAKERGYAQAQADIRKVLNIK